MIFYSSTDLVSCSLWYTTLGRTPLDEWSARRTTLTRGRHPRPLRDSNPQSHKPSGCRPTT